MLTPEQRTQRAPRRPLRTRFPCSFSSGTIVYLFPAKRGIRSVVPEPNKYDPPHVTPREPVEKPGGGEGGYRAQYKQFPLPTYSWRRVGADFVLVDHNNAAHKFTKEGIGGFLGAKASEMLSEKPGLVEAMTRCFEERTTIRKKFPHRYLSTEEGEPDEGRCLMVSFVFVSPDLVMVHTEDITERKDAEEQLRHAEAKYRTLVERMPAVTYVQEIGGPTLPCI